MRRIWPTALPAVSAVMVAAMTGYVAYKTHQIHECNLDDSDACLEFWSMKYAAVVTVTVLGSVVIAGIAARGAVRASHRGRAMAVAAATGVVAAGLTAVVVDGLAKASAIEPRYDPTHWLRIVVIALAAQVLVLAAEALATRLVPAAAAVPAIRVAAT